MIVGFINPKGGVGKSTLAIHTATELHRRGHKVLLVDTDKQGSSLDWAESADPGFTVISLPSPTVEHEASRLAKDYDHVIIDGGAKLEAIVVSCIKCVDVCVVPEKPSPLDVWASSEFIDLIKTRQSVTDGRPAAAFKISMAKSSTKLANEISDVLAGFDLPVLDMPITDRTSYPKSIALGRFVGEIDRQAADEIQTLVDQILAMVE